MRLPWLLVGSAAIAHGAHYIRNQEICRRESALCESTFECSRCSRAAAVAIQAAGVGRRNEDVVATYTRHFSEATGCDTSSGVLVSLATCVALHAAVLELAIEPSESRACAAFEPVVVLGTGTAADGLYTPSSRGQSWVKRVLPTPPSPSCGALLPLVGDGVCDSDANTPECGFDGGDCCAATCSARGDGDDETPCEPLQSAGCIEHASAQHELALVRDDHDRNGSSAQASSSFWQLASWTLSTGTPERRPRYWRAPATRPLGVTEAWQQCSEEGCAPSPVNVWVGCLGDRPAEPEAKVARVLKKKKKGGKDGGGGGGGGGDGGGGGGEGGGGGGGADAPTDGPTVPTLATPAPTPAPSNEGGGNGGGGGDNNGNGEGKKDTPAPTEAPATPAPTQPDNGGDGGGGGGDGGQTELPTPAVTKAPGDPPKDTPKPDGPGKGDKTPAPTEPVDKPPKDTPAPTKNPDKPDDKPPKGDKTPAPTEKPGDKPPKGDGGDTPAPTKDPQGPDNKPPKTPAPTPAPKDPPKPPQTDPPETPAPTAAATPQPSAVKTPAPTVAETPEPIAAKTPAPTVAETPEPIAAETPAPTAAETPEPIAAETPAPTAAETPEPIAAETPAPTVAETPEPIAAETPAPTAAETPEPTAAETPAPMAAETPEPTAAETPAPMAAETPEPTAAETPAPIAADTPAPTAAETAAATTADPVKPGPTTPVPTFQPATLQPTIPPPITKAPVTVPPTPAPTAALITPAPTAADTTPAPTPAPTTAPPTPPPTVPPTPAPTAPPTSPPATPDPNGNLYTLRMISTLEGQTADALTDGQQAAFTDAVAASVGQGSGDIKVVVTDKTTATRRRSLRRGRALQATGNAQLTYEIQNFVSQDAASAASVGLVRASTNGALLQATQMAATATGDAPLDATSITTIQSPDAPVSVQGGDSPVLSTPDIIGIAVACGLAVLMVASCVCMRRKKALTRTVRERLTPRSMSQRDFNKENSLYEIGSNGTPAGPAWEPPKKRAAAAAAAANGSAINSNSNGNGGTNIDFDVNFAHSTGTGANGLRAVPVAPWEATPTDGQQWSAVENGPPSTAASSAENAPGDAAAQDVTAVTAATAPAKRIRQASNDEAIWDPSMGGMGAATPGRPPLNPHPTVIQLDRYDSFLALIGGKPGTNPLPGSTPGTSPGGTPGGKTRGVSLTSPASTAGYPSARSLVEADAVGGLRAGAPDWAQDLLEMCDNLAQLFGTAADMSPNCRSIAWWATDVQAAIEGLILRPKNDAGALGRGTADLGALARAEDLMNELLIISGHHLERGTLPLYVQLRQAKDLVEGAARELTIGLAGLSLTTSDLAMIAAPRLRLDNSVASTIIPATSTQPSFNKLAPPRKSFNQQL